MQSRLLFQLIDPEKVQAASLGRREAFGWKLVPSVHTSETKMWQLQGENNSTQTFAKGNGDVGESHPDRSSGMSEALQVLPFQSRGFGSMEKQHLPGVSFQRIPLLRVGLLCCPVVMWPNQRGGFASHPLHFPSLCDATLLKRPSFRWLSKSYLLDFDS